MDKAYRDRLSVSLCVFVAPLQWRNGWLKSAKTIALLVGFTVQQESRTDGNFQVGASGASFNVTSTGAVTAAFKCVTAEGLIVRSNSGLQLRNATNDAWATLGFDGSRLQVVAYLLQVLPRWVWFFHITPMETILDLWYFSRTKRASSGDSLYI
jgi:hypothetical protein